MSKSNLIAFTQKKVWYKNYPYNHYAEGWYVKSKDFCSILNRDHTFVIPPDIMDIKDSYCWYPMERVCEYREDDPGFVKVWYSFDGIEWNESTTESEHADVYYLTFEKPPKENIAPAAYPLWRCKTLTKCWVRDSDADEWVDRWCLNQSSDKVVVGINHNAVILTTKNLDLRSWKHFSLFKPF